MRNRSICLGLAIVFLASTSVGAGVVRQVTDSKAVSFDWPMLGGTGSEVLVVNSSDQYGGGNPYHLYQIVSFDPTTGTGTPLSSFTSSLSHVRHNLSVSDDGQKLAFISDGDLVPGQNGNRSPEVFVMNRDGSGLSQLTDDSTPNAGSTVRLALSGDGSRVAFASSSDLTGGNASRVPQVFVVDFDGTGLAQLTQATEGEIQHMWVSDDGTRISFAHNGDLTAGGNPEKNYEVFTFEIGDTLPRQVTSSVTGDSMAANISGNGNTIVFHSTADLTGGNADGGLEIFAADNAAMQVTHFAFFVLHMIPLAAGILTHYGNAVTLTHSCYSRRSSRRRLPQPTVAIYRNANRCRIIILCCSGHLGGGWRGWGWQDDLRTWLLAQDFGDDVAVAPVLQGNLQPATAFGFSSDYHGHSGSQPRHALA